jgi:MATE family multidrug resistance protein
MAGALGACILWFERGTKLGVASLFQGLDLQRFGTLWRLGFPAAMQIMLEVGAFGTAAILAGRLAPAALAAHQISINSAALAYMVPLGVASAAAVTVGQSIGRRQFARARREGYMAIALGSGFMCLSGLLFWLDPEPILRIYTPDKQVLEIGSNLLAIAAIFQLFDGIQTVTTGALRGVGNTRTPMIMNLGGYYIVGLPLGYFLCFSYGYGIYGLWIGLSVALIAIAIYLLISWNFESRKLLAVRSEALAPLSGDATS